MLTPKFELGQKVYAINPVYDTKVVHVPCSICGSTGIVKVHGVEQDVMCPYCYGRTTTERVGFKYIISYRGATIGKREITEYLAKYLYHGDYKNEVTYMLKETGVGSGTIWHEHRLFATEEEAQEFCDKYVPADQYGTEAIPKESKNE
jgi:ribosomal protein S24E